ncbi:MAG: hypothetical protein CMJ37_05250 [Phycisphaerae bacterium]|nr:hypothetical protein [Phycisphaerae bacterium]
MVGLLWTLLCVVGSNDEAILTLRGGGRESVQISEADANGILVQQGLSLQWVYWDQILHIEGLSSKSEHQAAIDAWLPHAELLWRFRSRLERLDFQGAARLAPDVIQWKDHPSRIGLLVREGLFQIALAEGNLASAVPHLLAFGDRLAIESSTGTKGSRLNTPVTGAIRLHPHFPPIIPPGPDVALAREAIAQLPPAVDPLSIWLRGAWDVVLARADGQLGPLPDWGGSSPVPRAVQLFRACELGTDGEGSEGEFTLWTKFADRSPSRRAVLDRVEVLARGAPSPMSDIAGWQAVEMLRSMSLPTEADRLLQHLRQVDADALLFSASQGSF